MKNEMKRGLALLLCLAMVVGVFVGVPGMTTVANAAASSTTKIGDATNGTFEDAIDTKWTLSNKTQVKIVADAGRDGSNALYINDPGSGGYNAYSNRFDVQPGTSITYSVWSKGIEAQSYLFWFKADGTACSPANSGNSKLAAADDWTLTTVTKTVPADAAYAEIRLATGGDATGEAWFDDVSVRGTKINVRNTNLPGFLAKESYNQNGLTTTYNATTDTATITSTATSGTYANGRENLKSSTVPIPVSTTFVVEFTLSNTVQKGEQTTQGYVHVVDQINASTENLGYVYYGQGTSNGQHGDGFYSFEFTTLAAETTDLRLQVRPRIDFTGSYDLSGLTVYAKTGEVLNGSFDETFINGWTLTDTAGTSWAISEGRNTAQGLALIDNSTTAFASVTSDYIPVKANYARQRPVGYMGAKGTGLTGVTYYYHYYDKNYVELKPTTEKWDGASKTNTWRAATGSRNDITESWATKAMSTSDQFMYIPYGTAYLTIEIRTGTAVGDTGTLYIDNVYVNLFCDHINGTHQDATTTAESTLTEVAYKAPTYKIGDTEAAEGISAHHECSVCGVKYKDATASTVVTAADVTLPAGEALRNIDQGNSLDMIFALKATDLANMNIDPANVTADITFLSKSLTGLKVEEYNDKTYGTLYRVEFPNISAKEMYDVMTVKFYNGEEEIYSGTQNIRSYAYDCITKDADKHSAEWITACKDLLHYGGAAQTYFEHRLTQLASNNVEASGTAFTPDKTLSVSVGEGLFIASTIRFQSNLKMVFAVDATSGATSGTISFTNHKGEVITKNATPVAATVNGESSLCFEFDGMVVADLNCDITFTASNGETVVVQAVDSMNAYIGRVLANSTNANMKALAQAFGNYSTSAYAYLHKDDEA